jgi:hypothetical protein
VNVCETRKMYKRVYRHDWILGFQKKGKTSYNPLRVWEKVMDYFRVRSLLCRDERRQV